MWSSWSVCEVVSVPYVDVVCTVTVMRVMLHVSMVKECEGARVTNAAVRGGVVVVIAGHVCVDSTRGSGIVSSAIDVLRMSVDNRIRFWPFQSCGNRGELIWVVVVWMV